MIDFLSNKSTHQNVQVNVVNCTFLHYFRRAYITINLTNSYIEFFLVFTFICMKAIIVFVPDYSTKVKLKKKKNHVFLFPVNESKIYETIYAA